MLGVVVMMLGAATAAQAQTSRTWVSGTGNDADPCSRVLPCQTFAGAMAKTIVGGEIDALDFGGFGALTITKSITIAGGGYVAGILASGSYGINIVAGPNDVVIIRNLDMNGVGNTTLTLGLTGIRVAQVGQLHVENCTIYGFSIRGIDFLTSTRYLYVKDSTIKDNNGAAVYVGAGHGVIERLTANGNQTGVLAGGSAAVTVKSSVVSGGAMGFAAAYGPTAQLNIEDSVAANNQWALVAGNGATIYASNTSVFNNYIRGIFNDGVSFVVSYGNNRFAGNAVDGSFTSTIALR